jgi:hypothetical protein
MRKVSYGRIVYVEPNDIVASTGESVSLDNVSWNPEELNMAVDLQVIVPRRSDFGSRNSSSGKKSIVEIWAEGMDDLNRYISFMQGADIKDNNGNLVGHELTTDYINASYTEVTSQGQSCKEALGIDSIDITFDQHFYPQVNIKFIDVRGYSLMMPTEDVYRLEHVDAGSSRLNKGGYINFFRALFHYPYPRFLLTVKGFYGTSVTFQLAVNEFRNNFNSDTGNFEITVSFIGYMYGLYTDVPLNLLIAAPYYGSDSNSEDSKTSSHWDNPNFVYDNGNGQPGRGIFTFIEFLEQCNKLNDAIAKTKNNSSQYSTLGKANENAAKITALGELKKKLSNYVKATLDIHNKSEKNSYIVANDGFDVIWFKVDQKESDIGDNNDNGKFEVAISEWSAFAKAWNDYIQEDKLNTPIWQPGGTLSKDNVYYSKIDNEEEDKWQEYYEPFYKNLRELKDGNITAYQNTMSSGGVTIDCIKQNYPELQEKILKSGYAENNVYYIMGSFIVKIIDDRINVLRDEQKDIQPQAKNELDELYVQNLGFNPSVLNIYRMIFAHMDCFMQIFYQVANRITKNPESRKLANFGVTKENMDVSSYMSADAIVPPFPAIYDFDDDNRRVQIYPGEKPELISKMPELELVEGLINGALGAKKRARQIICDMKEKATYNQENEAASNDTDYSYTPSAISDFMHQSNPYSEVLSGSANDLMLCLMSRILSATLQLYMSDKNSENSLSKIGDIESRNFTNLHPETVTEKLKQDLKSMADRLNDDEDGVFNDLVKYWNQQGLNNAEYEDGYLRFNVEKAPIFSQSYPSFESNSVIIDSDGYSKLTDKTYLTEKRAERDFERIKQFKNKIQSLSSPENNGESQLTHEYGELLQRVYTTPTANLNDAIPFLMREDKDLPKILDIMGCSVRNEKFPFKGISNSHGYVFFNKENDIYFPKDEDRAGLFLLYLNAYIYGPNIAETTTTNEHGVKTSYGSKGRNTANAQVIIPNISRTSITTMTFPAACLLGYALKKGVNTPILSIDGKNNATVQFIFAKSQNEFLPSQYATTVYSRIYNNHYLKEKLIKIFDDFSESDSWRKIRKELTNANNYIKPDKDDKNQVWNMKLELSRLIRDTMLGQVNGYNSATDVAVYVVNNETKYSDNVKSVKIPKGRFIDAIKLLATHYGGMETEYERTDPHFDKSDVNNAYRLALYNALKNLYDKWANSYDETDFRLRHPSDDYRIKASRFQTGEQNNSNACEFDNFMFVDCFYNDISDIFRMNPLIISDIVGKQVQAESNYSVYECMADIMQKNRMLLLTLPVYCNFYNFNEIEKLFTPNPMSIMSKGLGSTYVGMYTYEVSHVVDDERFDDHLDKDYFMIADLNGVADDPRPTKEGEKLFSYNGKRLSIPVPAFGVTYARQNQSYFKRIDVNMDNPRVTDYSIYNMFLLTNSVEGNELNRPLTVANDIYSIYANRSYNCSVEMMGCANIMPMMYFQLNNIPMFRGAYMISNVEHHISAGNFTTKFSGVRISKNQLPYNTKIFDYDNSFDFNTVGGGVYGLTESPTSYDEGYGVSNVKVSFPSCENCVGWDVNAALAMMEVPKDYGLATKRGGSGCKGIPNQDYERLKQPDKGGFAPATNTSSHSCCASAVKTFIRAGYLAVANDASRPEEERSWARKRSGAEYCRTIAGANNVHGQLFHTESAEVNMAKNGFKHIYTTVSTTQAGVDKELKEFTYGGVKGVQPGDICTMLHAGSLSGGHIHMYRGSQYPRPWVSDYCDDNAYVYGNSVKKGDVWIYRFVGSKDLNNIESTKKHNTMQGGFPQGVAYHPEKANQPKAPYRIFNIDRGARAAKKMNKNVSKITSYESLDLKYRSGKAAWANKRFTTHQDATSACAFFIYYIKERFLDRVSGGFTIGNLAKSYTGESNWRQYASDVAKYLSNKLNRSITPNSTIEYNEPFMCALGEIIAVKEQSKNVTQYIHTAWSQANSA